jgi:hypothetical protein
MKLLTPFLLFASVVILLPLHAQPASDGATPSASDSSVPQNVPVPPHNIMSWSTGHKPNPVNPPPEIAVPMDKFFKTLKAGDYANAFETFLSGTRLGEQKEKMSAMISHTEEGFGIYGALKDYEIYDNYAIGSNVLVLTYLTRHDLQPLRWRFIYYRADKTWHVINLGYDDFLLDLIN